MRRFPGSYLSFDAPLNHPAPEIYAPSIAAVVAWDDRAADVDFLIDTGSQSSTLSEMDARTLLGTAYEELDFNDPNLRASVFGIGGEIDAVSIEVSMTLTDDVDVVEEFYGQLLVMRPSPPGLNGQENLWKPPSLLGRDVLLRFGLHAIYEQNSVYLTLPG
jgi:hypothetical protein